jgi:hypothetical protein
VCPRAGLDTAEKLKFLASAGNQILDAYVFQPIGQSLYRQICMGRENGGFCREMEYLFHADRWDLIADHSDRAV